MTEQNVVLRPLVVTAQLEDEAFRYFDMLRQRYFPPERNHLRAHISLFHRLPGEEQAFVSAAVRRICAHPAPHVRVTGVRSLGRGVAFTLESAALAGMHRMLAEAFAPWLTAQDRAAFRPHITVQNKVSPEEARVLRNDLAARLKSWTFAITGVAIWRYEGGPWDLLEEIAFAGGTSAP